MGECKQNAPFLIYSWDYIDAEGRWGPKRMTRFINNWNPALLHSARSNHDIKLISNGSKTKDILWYVANYVVKKQWESSNISALFMKRIVYHCKQEQYNSNLKEINKQLLQCCANRLS